MRLDTGLCDGKTKGFHPPKADKGTPRRKVVRENTGLLLIIWFSMRLGVPLRLCAKQKDSDAATSK